MPTTHPIDISWLDLFYAAVLILISIGISSFQKLGLGRSLVIGAIRATLQLIAVGYILRWVFALDRWYVVVVVLLIMVAFATQTITERLKGEKQQKASLRWICAGAIFLGSVLTLAYVDTLVVPITPWYSPRYLIPLFGMIVSNSMNGAALAAERLHAEIEARRSEIESYLALGASPQQASATCVSKALIAAMIPAVNSLAVVGVVSLPGMMTGQILAGADPTLAVRYQLVVVFMLTAATAITATTVVYWYRRQFFNAAEQLLPRVECA
ncbi:MAG: iron export ABC transporter permease subunit FetB [Burkholderiales bacterium]|nr:iron export ABC transporter permease subunit FetB [Burkholderiales bacterium]